jgi:hypothetical protein
MSETSWFFTSRPAYPWSVYPVGLPALGVVAGLLVAVTVWTYVGHPQASRKRILTVLALRLLALVVALLTAVRPSVGVQEEPKVPTALLVAVDTSESMTVKDEVNNQARIDAVRKTLERCRPTLDELANDHQVTVYLYKFSTSDFSPDVSLFEPTSGADGKRSDYGTVLNKLFEKWQGERFVRGLLVVGDGADNGVAFPALGQAARWGQRAVPLTTFVVGTQSVQNPDAKDLAVVALSADPSPAPIKTDLNVVARVNAFGYTSPRVKARVLFDDRVVAVEEVTLAREQNNEVRIPVKAPATAGEIKVRFEVGQEVTREENGKPVTVFEPLAGEISPLNNFSETYLTVTKEGVRVLVIDRLRPENARLLDALRGEKRFDINFVNRQSAQATPEDVQALDLEGQGVDVVIVGNVSASHLLSADPRFFDKLTDRVGKKGMGLMFLGGEAAFVGLPAPKDGDWRTRQLEFADLLPVYPNPGRIIETAAPGSRPSAAYQTVPTPQGLDRFIMRIGKDAAESRQLWDDLNGLRKQTRLTGLSDFRAKPTATVFAWSTPAGPPQQAGPMPATGAHPLLVAQQLGTGKSGRILAFAGYDSYLWETLGQPKTRQGIEIHNRFWKQCVLWLAHQEEEEGQVYARPDLRRLPVGGDQTVRVGFKAPGGGDDPNAELTVKILPKGQDAPTDEDRASPQPILRDATGAKVLFKPPAAGEYTVVVTSPMKDKDGKPVTGADGKPAVHRGTARFIAYPDVSDEMLRVAAVPEFLQKLSAQSGGRALQLEDLPAFLKELKGQPLDTVKPKPKYYPDWRRDHSKGFLTGWFVLFVILLGTEWGLRRLWGLV